MTPPNPALVAALEAEREDLVPAAYERRRKELLEQYSDVPEE